MEEQLKALLESAIAETGADLSTAVDEVALYAAERMAVLATLIGQVGYEQAVIAERPNGALMAGISAGGSAHAPRPRRRGRSTSCPGRAAHLASSRT